MFLIIVNVLLIIAGNFMEPSAIIMIMVPLLFPVAVALGIDPIHFGIIIVVNMELGMISPPVGLNLFVTAVLQGKFKRCCCVFITLVCNNFSGSALGNLYTSNKSLATKLNVWLAHINL